MNSRLWLRCAALAALSWTGLGCESSPSATPESPPTEATAGRELREWQEIHIREIEGVPRPPRHVGYIERRHRGEVDRGAIVYDLEMHPVGLISPTGTVHRYQARANSSELDTIEVTKVDIELGILEIFDVESGAVEYAPIVDARPATSKTREKS
jgi:hypothetical protein